MARLARKQMADLRAMEEESRRNELHGGAKKFVGCGATPSMGLSQYRGGAMCGGDMEGAGRFQFRVPRITAPRPTSTALALRPSLTSRTGAMVPLGALGRPVARPSMPASFYSNLGRSGTSASARAATTARPSLLSRASSALTAANLAKAAALGIPLGMLGAYLADQGGDSGEGGYYDDYESGGPLDPTAPAGPMPPFAPTVPTDAGDFVDLDGDGIPDSVIPRGRSGRSTDFQFRSGNVEFAPRRGAGQLTIHHGGARKPDGRTARAAIVRQVMAERGVSLPQASRIVKEEGLYSR